MFKKRNNKKKEESCPLCQVSDETLKRLKKSGNQKNECELTKNNDKSENRK